MRETMQRARSTFRRAFVVGISGAANKVLTLVGLADQQKTAEWIEPYGLAAMPKIGAETIAQCIDGDESHSVVVVVGDRRFRFDVADGEVAVYTYINAARPHRLHLKNDGTIELLGDELRIEVPKGADLVGDLRMTGKLTLIGDLEQTGNQNVTGDTTASGTVTGKTDVVFGDVSGGKHRHGGVQNGEDMSGGPQ
ncbi:bacteriophage Mu Gp45 family protein [Burkholderia sp. MSHR3999]|uniref:phage baseplate assembly protein domain-containing protein n=1 Tax=Burkholderia sp. MSHR3999 TaxID=1542965 RepID=UPI0005B6CD8E|nr:phage baseplate assembly protein [Burkholderia sp. MSHR3999]KIP14334.1 bacteriophage Mu Gp45 family protein [Burkholderia sp. MSHR3999]